MARFGTAWWGRAGLGPVRYGTVGRGKAGQGPVGHGLVRFAIISNK